MAGGESFEVGRAGQVAAVHRDDHVAVAQSSRIGATRTRDAAHADAGQALPAQAVAELAELDAGEARVERLALQHAQLRRAPRGAERELFAVAHEAELDLRAGRGQPCEVVQVLRTGPRAVPR